MASTIFKLVKGTKNPRECKKIDALRLKKYIGCYIYQNRNSPLEDMVRRAKAPVEHLFNCHEWCDEQWCWEKQLDSKQHEITTRIMELNRTPSSECSDSSDESDWETLPDIDDPTTTPTGNDPLTPPDNNESENDSDWESIYSSESDTDLEDMGLDEDELKECQYFAKFEENTNVDESIFTPKDHEEMKNRERIMVERNERGYYRCKIKDRQLYEEIMSEYSRFITPDMMKQLNHC